MRRAGWRALTTAAIVGVWLVWAGAAHAGYGVQPASGTATGPQPTFLVYLDSQDSIPEVWVSSSPQMDSIGFPAQDLGNCTPTTPFGEANKYTCKPALYSGTFTSSLAPGTYYWWMTFLRQDPGQLYPTTHISGPFSFTVAQPTQPANTYLDAPADGASVSETPRLSVTAPGSAQVTFYVSTSSETLNSGAPALDTAASCSGTTDADGGIYYCDVEPGALYPGETYYWWVLVTVDGTPWRYGPRSFTATAPSAGSGVGTASTGSTGSGVGTGSGTGGKPKKTVAPPRTIVDAPSLHPSAHYRGESVRQTRLGNAAYALSKALGYPKTVDVACWSVHDWTNISGRNPETGYTLLGFYLPAMPHWLQLSPNICRSAETLLYHRPKYTNRYTSNAVDTLTHEMLHALGVKDEAQTECFAMQLSYVTGVALGLPLQYAENLDRLSLSFYGSHPPRYIDRARCREGGAWDIAPNKPSLPWHLPAV